VLLIFTVALALSVNAGEPRVEEKTLPDGLTELRVVSDAGKDLAVYKVDLKTHHEPATNGTGLIKNWENYRFGGFFCFNDNQFNGEEFSKNKDSKLFNPSKLDISCWVQAMKKAGMNYAVLTTRHTSGFLLWDSATTEFDVGNSPGKPDVVGEFVKECRKVGIAPAFYYCLWGGGRWMPHPNARAIILAQLNELATKFGEIPYFWIDMGNWRPENLSVQEIYDCIKNAQPNAVVIMNQHVQDGQRINYFPTDVMNGEVVVPPAGGHQPIRTVNGKQYYLPFEFEPVSQRISKGTTTPLGAVGAWFTYGEGRGFEASKPIDPKILFDWIKQAYERGTANVLLSLAADHTGSMRVDDAKQLEDLGEMLREAGLLETPKAVVPPAKSLAMGKPGEAIKAKPESIEAWKDMRFGMFICWGPVTLTGKEVGWSRGDPTPVEKYDNLYKEWNPTNFDARAWVKVVKDTGAKYVVFLTKHHDGFCLFDTKHTDFNIMNGPFKRDVTKELADACHSEGIGFFPYYSTCDWHHPDFPVTSPGGRTKRQNSNLDKYTEYLEAQTGELIKNYGPLTGIWFDVPQCFDNVRGERVIRHVRLLQPDILVNNRTGAPGDFDTPEQQVGTCQFNRPWESCITLGTQWTWKPDDKLKPYTDAVKMLVACAVGDGNLALNTNPMPDGRIEPRQVEQFREVGNWLQKYGESIYGTRGGPFVAPDMGKRKFNQDLEQFAMSGGGWWGGSTHKGKVIYLHILRWPADTIKLPSIRPHIVKHSVLTGGEVTMKQTADGIEVSVPQNARDKIDTIIKLELDGPTE